MVLVWRVLALVLAINTIVVTFDSTEKLVQVTGAGLAAIAFAVLGSTRHQDSEWMPDVRSWRSSRDGQPDGPDPSTH